MASQITKSRNLIWGNLVKRKFSSQNIFGHHMAWKNPWWQMAPIEISFIGTFSYELRGGNSLIPWNSAGGFEVGPKKPGGERNLSYKIYFLGHLPGTPQLPYMTRIVWGPIWQHWDLNKKNGWSLWRFFGAFFGAFFFCNTWGEAAWCSSWCFFLRSADVCFYFSKMKVFLLEVKLGMHKDKMDENYNHTLYICILYSIYI